MSKKQTVKTKGIKNARKTLQKDEALAVCAEVLHELLLEGINTLTLTTVDDETIKVHIVPQRPVEKKKH